MTVSVCVPVYRQHGEPNVATLASSLSAALADLDGELVVALNGVSAPVAGVPASAVTVDLGINRGVAPGWNAAARAARGELLVFTNDDVLLGTNSLALMAQTLLERAEAGVVGPVGSHWNLKEPAHVAWVDMGKRPAGEVEQCEVVSGFLFAARREVYNQAGGFDEVYAPCSYEEVDFCTAVRKRLGLKCYAVAGVGYEHEFRISFARPWTRVHYDGRSEMIRSIHRRNSRYFRRKWTGIV
jgi:GT2 family glycosyltransferase